MEWPLETIQHTQAIICCLCVTLQERTDIGHTRMNCISCRYKIVIQLCLGNANQNAHIKVCHAYLKNNSVVVIYPTTPISLFSNVHLIELFQRDDCVFL